VTGASHQNEKTEAVSATCHCLAGSYGTNSSGCRPCPVAHFCEYAATTPTSCGDGYTSVAGAKAAGECTRETNTFIEMQFSYEDANSPEKKKAIEAGVVSSIVKHSATSADDIWLKWSDGASSGMHCF
jgi:hypothetical protein